jgi:hypothetical protein
VLPVMSLVDKMLKFSEYMSESYFVQYIRDKNVDVLKLKDSKQASWVEVRGKKNYEVTYDKNDPMHKAIDGLGKAASISDLMNGDVVSINPHHPHGKKAIETVERLMK